MRDLEDQIKDLIKTYAKKNPDEQIFKREIAAVLEAVKYDLVYRR